MNKLEKALLDGAVEAQEQYIRVSGGWWLWHGPESFILPYLSERVADEGFVVYPEKSPKKIDAELGVVKRGKPPKNIGERFDLVVWYKSKDEVRAVVEVKRAQNISPVRSDFTKVQKHLSQGVSSKGYLLVYSEARGDDRRSKLIERFKHWSDETDTWMVGYRVDEEDDGEWSWGFVLLRLDA